MDETLVDTAITAEFSLIFNDTSPVTFEDIANGFNLLTNTTMLNSSTHQGVLRDRSFSVPFTIYYGCATRFLPVNTSFVDASLTSSSQDSILVEIAGEPTSRDEF